MDAAGSSSVFPFDQIEESAVPEATVVPGELMIKMTPDALSLMTKSEPDAKAGPEYGGDTLGGLLAMYQASPPKAAFPSLVAATVQTKSATKGVVEPSEEDLAREELSRWYSISVDPSLDMETVAATFAAASGVECAEPNIEWGLTDEIPTVIEGLPDGTTDPQYDDQWYHGNAKIPDAWNHLNTNGVYPGGKRDVVVAVIDTGVDYTHEELVGNMWVNPDEIPGNDIDDDLNGFVDDVHGCSVVSDGRSHAGDPVDFHGHGTHVAGIVAAQGFNDLGGVGVAFNTQIMAVRAAQYSGTLTTQDISEGILYAAENGAEVLNMSFGGYQKSQIVIDALEVALNQCVLVAAAGNDGLSSDRYPMYPAALPWVVGVMASNTKRGLTDFSNYGPDYEIKAPGVSILSTLPDNGYAQWSGTSMAAPIVSGVAALMRSYFWQRDIYSSRFIMGSITASGAESENVVNAYKSLTEPPKPGVDLYENWLFDDVSISPANDEDGRPDSGETLHIAVELINRSGSAENVTATLTAQAPSAALPDPYVTIINDTVDFGNIGPFAMADNDLIWNDEGVITGVEVPFVFTVSPDCPNDHVIPFVLTTTFEDGWDEEHAEYTRVSRFNYIVQRGKNIPTVISEDTVLTSDEFWMVGGPVLIEEQATLTIAEGAQVQWGAVSDDPYNPGPQAGNIVVRGNLFIEGSEERPVTLFPSYLVSGQQTNISVEAGGHCNVRYARIRNPRLTGLNDVDHCYIDWDSFTSTFSAESIANTVFHNYQGSAPSAGTFDTVLFDQSRVAGNVGYDVTNSTFLQDNANNAPTTLYIPREYHEELTELQSNKRFYTFLDPQYHEGDTYVVLPMEWDCTALAELIAQYFDGHLVSVHGRAEQEWITEYLQMPKLALATDGYVSYYLLGATTRNVALDGNQGVWGEYRWVDGTPMDYTNWDEGQPAALPNSKPQEIVVDSTTGLWSTRLEQDGGRWGGHGHPTAWPGYVLRIPGRWTYEELMEPYDNGELLAHVEENYHGPVRYNAFLSKSWDPNIDNWMRITPASGSTPEWNANLWENYWGTDSAELVQHMVYDYYDTFVTAKLHYGSPPEHGYESTYPFVESVLINGVPAESVPEVGAGPTTFTINFNRDMDPDVQPFVTFGPSSPHTDFEVHPIGGNDAGYNDNVVTFTVTLSTPSSQTATVKYTTMDGTAIAGVDYEAVTGTLTFVPGQTQETIEVPILGDIDEEADKSFTVALSDPTFATIADATATGTLEDDDPTLAVEDVAIREGDGEAVEAVFTVSLSAIKDETVTVLYETADGTAKAGVDYEAVGGMLTFEPGETEKTVAVAILGNMENQSDRGFSLRLLHPRTASIRDNEAEATIQDDDPAILVEGSVVAEGDEGTTDGVFTVRLSAPPLRTVTFDYATEDGTATAGSDYQAAGGTLTFEVGDPIEQTVVVPVVGDLENESYETFTLALSNVTNSLVVEQPGDIMITGDDGIRISADTAPVTEGGSWETPWSRYIGDAGADTVYDMEVDAAGNTWLVGGTTSSEWAFGGYDTSYGGEGDGFVAKLDPQGEVEWVGYLGGSDQDYAQGVALDTDGNVWITGWTQSAGWVTGGHQIVHGGGADAFLVKLDSDGDLLWSSFLGGPGQDDGRDVAHRRGRQRRGGRGNPALPIGCPAATIRLTTRPATDSSRNSRPTGRCSGRATSAGIHRTTPEPSPSAPLERFGWPGERTQTVGFRADTIPR